MSATHVFANGHEIASQAVGKSGRSSSAMPDPCWSPPAPGAGPVVIPYPNTCFADSITKGTSTVMIGGKTVAIADQSRFDTSIGNEGATQAFNKGVATGVIKGKAYFTKWSSDVVFEGYGVPRDMDLVTHNHGSQPSNTPTFPFISSRDMEGVCKEDAERVKSACRPVSEHSALEKDLMERDSVRAALRMTHKAKAQGDWNWTHDHCDGLDLALGSHSLAKSYLNGIANALDGAASNLASLVAAENNLVSAFSGASGAVDQRAAAAALQRRSALESKLADINQLRDTVAGGNYPKKNGKELVQGFGASAQDYISELNDCTRAKKCVLTPFSSSAEDPNRENSQKDKLGCCNGQTGHHLIYGVMMKDACPDYENTAGNKKHKDAPTVCVEGTSQNVGSHKRVHDKMDKRVRRIVRRKVKRGIYDGTLSMGEAINAAASSHRSAFPFSDCDAACITAQLESFYDKACPNVRPNAIDKYGNPVEQVIRQGSRGGKR